MFESIIVRTNSMKHPSRIGSPALALAVLAVALLALSASHGIGDEPSSRSVLSRPVPKNTDDLMAIERAVGEVVERAVPCTVGLDVDFAQGSGVIVSRDGYVLTAGHVIGRPGRDVQIKLPDGRTASGKTLGVHTAADLGLVKITDPGPWPFAPIVKPGEAPKVGDWCVATGHPNGFQADRPAPVRFGRVIDLRDAVLRTDCPITGGDSGGPVFDMSGRVIGIHSRIAADLAENLHGPATAAAHAWDQLKAGEIYPPTPPSRFFDRFDIDRDGKVSRSELPDGLYARVFDRFAKKYKLDTARSYTVEELTKIVGFTPEQAPSDFGRPYFANQRDGSLLPQRRFIRGREVRRAFDDLAAVAAKSTVAIQQDGKRVALGTVVDADGLILTKASELSGEVTCKLHDGRTVAARILAQDRHADLALLRAEASGLNAAEWSDASALRPGNWLVTVGSRGAASVGVVSVKPRKIVGTPGVLGVFLFPSEDEARIRSVVADGGAADAGLQAGDVITHLMDQPIRNFAQLRAALHDYRADDVVQAKIRRGETTMSVDVTLGDQANVFSPFPRSRGTRFNGPLSRRRDGFDLAVQHDTVLEPSLCGGPVVDSSGKIVGINVARENRVASHAVPSEALRTLIAQLKADADSAAESDTQ